MTEKDNKIVRDSVVRRPPAAGKGRPKGALNKTTASVKAALQEAFDRKGGVPALMRWASENETEFYKLWAKLLPTDVTLADPNGQPLTIRVVRE